MLIVIAGIINKKTFKLNLKNRSREAYPESKIFGDGYGGINETKSDLTLDDVRNFYNLWYQPNRASMVIVGDIDENTWQEIQNIFSEEQISM